MSRATGAEVTLGEASVRLAWGWRLAWRTGRIAGTGPALAAATGSANDLETYPSSSRNLSVSAGPAAPAAEADRGQRSSRWPGPRWRSTWERGRRWPTDFELQLTDLNLGLEAARTGRRASRTRPPGELIPADLALVLHGAADTLVLPEGALHHVDLQGTGCAGS